MTNAPALSIVMPVYQAAATLPVLHARAAQAAQKLGGSYEIIFVNDGSTDDSLAVLQAIFESDRAHVVVVDLSRNFGQHPAIWRGLGEARGDLIFLLDGDLDDQPEWLFDLHHAMTEAKADVVFAASMQRPPGLRHLLSRGFYRLLRVISDRPVIPDLVCARLMTRRYVNALLLHGERGLYLNTLCALTGFAQQVIAVQKKPKHSSTYRLCSMMGLAWRGMASASLKPLHYLGAAGIVVGMVVTAGGILRLTWQAAALGFIMLQLGAISVYLALTLQEARQRPLTIVRHVYRAQDGTEQRA